MAQESLKNIQKEFKEWEDNYQTLGDTKVSLDLQQSKPINDSNQLTNPSLSSNVGGYRNNPMKMICQIPPFQIIK